MQVYNPMKISDSVIGEVKKKVRLLICNSNDEILVVKYNDIYMLPGGSLEENEMFNKAIKKALRREIKEEVGIDIINQQIEYLQNIICYQEDYPKENGKLVNRRVTTYYYKTRMDINLNNIKNNLTEREKKGGFQLEWIDKYKLRELLINYNSTNPRSEFFHDELRIVLGRYLWLHDIDLIDKNYEKLKRKKTKYIDMHTHTIYSDGELTPEELIKQAKENNIGVFSITDHDTINALKYIDKNKENIDLEYIQLIPGVELSAESKKGTMHILGYNFDIRNQELNEVLDNQRKRRTYRVISLLNILNSDYNIEFNHDDIKDLFNKKGNLGRVDLAKLCIKYGYATSVQEAFDKYLIEAYEKIRSNSKKLSYLECFNLIKNAGGYTFLAHPNQLLLEDDELEELIVKMKQEGLDGIEVYHSGHSKEETRKYLELADKYNLLISSGSDFHGINVKPNVKLANPKTKVLKFVNEISGI